jgi:predicted methyltransferase
MRAISGVKSGMTEMILRRDTLGGMSALPPLNRRAVPAAVPVYLSHFQATPLLRAWNAGETKARTSIDLNLTMVLVELSDSGVMLPDGRAIPWEAVREAEENERGCFVIDGDGALRKVQAYSPVTDRVLTLYPTPGPPTMLVSGVPMHRIKGTNPLQDTISKVRAISPIGGTVLDTATGLGYTATQASRSAARVITIEIDPAAHEIARMNPWSKELFDSQKVDLLLGDVYDVVPAFAAETFDCIIHDPPMFSLAGDLYSTGFYAELRRVLRPGGRMFHYIGDPDSKMSGSVTRGVARRLEDAGFQRVKQVPEAFGVTAAK